MKKLVSTLLLLGLLAYAAFKGGVWWLADQGLEETRLSLASEGVLQRGTIGSSVVGELALNAPSYQPFRMTQAFRAKRLIYKTDSPVALVDALMNPGSLPVSWQLEVEDVSLKLDAAMFRNWVTATDSETPSLFAPVCGPDHRQRLGSGDLVRIGITEVVGEMALQQSASGLYGELTTAGSGSVEIDWPGARVTVPGFTGIRVSSAQPLTLTLRDGGVLRKVAAYCAQESGVAVTEWAQIVMNAFLHGLQNYGYEPSEQMLALYRQWLTEGGEIIVQLQPDETAYGIPVVADGEDAGLWLRYNGSQVPDVFLQRIEPELQLAPTKAREPVVADVDAGNNPGWVRADIDSAAGLEGYQIRVSLRNGRIVEGRLVAATDTHLEVARMINGGEVTYSLATGSVTGFKVRQRDHR